MARRHTPDTHKTLLEHHAAEQNSPHIARDSRSPGANVTSGLVRRIT